MQQGCEAALTVDLARELSGVGDRLAVMPIWTHDDFRFVRAPVYVGSRIAGIPDDVLRTVLGYGHPGGF